MPVLYDDLGLRFLFPENWSLEADDEIADRPTVTVYAPGGAFWSVMLREDQADPAELAHEAKTTLRKEYPGADCDEITENLCDVELQGYDLNFIYLDLISTACIRAARTPRGTLLIVCQAEDREYQQLHDVFQAMTVSLLNETVQGQQIEAAAAQPTAQRKRARPAVRVRRSSP